MFCELPEEGTKVDAKVKFGQVESVKAVSDVNSPISGEVVEFNSSLSDNPQLVSQRNLHAYHSIEPRQLSTTDFGSLLGLNVKVATHKWM